MAILEKEVWVTLSNKIISHYDSLGYEIPKYKDKDGVIRVKKGTKILVEIDDLTKGSTIKVTKICDDCGKKIDKKQKYQDIVSVREKGDGKDRCSKCGGRKSANSKLNNISYQNSLEYWAKVNNKEYLLEEFSDKNKKRPIEISYGSCYEYLWNCQKCDNEYLMVLSKRTSRDSSCPYCSGRKILIGYNDLKTTHPEIASMLVNKQKGYELTAGSNKKENFKCNECGYIIRNKTINDVTSYGISCPKCSDGFKFPEKLFISMLSQIKISYETQKVFEWSENKRYDFYLSTINTIVELHGNQHYGIGFEKLGGRTLQEEQENDKLKEQLAIKNGIERYIIIDCRHSDLEWIKNNILNSELNELFDLNKVNWLKCYEYAVKSLVRLACDLWNSGIKRIKRISEILNVCSATIKKYLKQGFELGWCDYDVEIEKKKTQTKKKPIVQLSLDGKFIKEWKGAIDAAKELGINKNTISNACSGKLKSAGGFMWILKNNYESDKIKPYVFKHIKAVVKLDLHGKFIDEYESIAEASRCNGNINTDLITDNCKGRRETYKGFKWIYKTDYN